MTWEDTEIRQVKIILPDASGQNIVFGVEGSQRKYFSAALQDFLKGLDQQENPPLIETDTVLDGETHEACDLHISIKSTNQQMILSAIQFHSDKLIKHSKWQRKSP